MAPKKKLKNLSKKGLKKTTRVKGGRITRNHNQSIIA